MAYRRRQGMTRASTFKEEIVHRPPDDMNPSASPLQPSHSFNASSSLAAQAIRASALSNERNRTKDFAAYEDSSAKSGFWGVLARKAKAILEEEDAEFQQSDVFGDIIASPKLSPSPLYTTSGGPTQFQQKYQLSDNRMEHPAIRKGLDRITTSLNNLGDTFEKAFEEGRTIVESKTADIRHQIQRRGDQPEGQNQASYYGIKQARSPDTQIKASRDVAMATAAKAKLLLRELKTVKADLAFAKERCSQLEEENKRLRESREKGVNRADDDLIRHQLETLLAEKGRLANENSVYARENRFLREIVEYHQLTMQDVVYLSDEETEVYPLSSSPEVAQILSLSPHSSAPPSPPPEDLSSMISPDTKEILAAHINPQANKDASQNEVTPSSDISPSVGEVAKTPSVGEVAKTPSVAEVVKTASVVEESKTDSVAEDTKRPPASSA
ncbi:PREDICTED: uncharacterized protein LOC101296878 [Fragaria vesca subsp. vesca]|uniref:uncharacterized protein LOC101296878 n=1 Tax=Fragaria vesca subsp. vesca TaxID=101020 RepID=UPI0002C34102|nr:PREDICTED: uncharacterized protein LOC101296878 [Fragaria vesca subsp. vesca]